MLMALRHNRITILSDIGFVLRNALRHIRVVTRSAMDFYEITKRVIVVVLLGEDLFMVRTIYTLCLSTDPNMVIKPSALALSSYKVVIQQNQSQELRVTPSGLTLLRRRQDAFRRY